MKSKISTYDTIRAIANARKLINSKRQPRRLFPTETPLEVYHLAKAKRIRVR
jgi:hypothetical protein